MRRLTKEGEELRKEYERHFASTGCSCHISPPCPACLHPGSPWNLEVSEDLWEEVEEVPEKIEYKKIYPFIEAVELTPLNITSLAKWCKGEFKGADLAPGNGWIEIKDSGDSLVANIGDYIIKESTGKFYPCTAGIFNNIYEEVDE